MKTLYTLFATFIVFSTLSQNALNFDGIDDRIITTVAGVSGNGARTIEARIRTTANALPTGSGGTGQKVMVDWGSTSTGARSTFNLLFNNAIRFEVAGNGVNGTIPVNDGLWHHVAVVYDPTVTNTVSLYVDGVLDIAGNLTVTVNTSTLLPIRIGRRVDDAGHFEGDMDEVRVWNVARTQAQIQANMNNELCNLPASLILYLPLNQGIAGGTNTGLTNALNYSTNNGTATLSGFSLTGSTSNWVSGFAHTPGFQVGATNIVSACGLYTWSANNLSYTNSGNHKATIPATTGCDSIVYLNLTVNPIAYTTQNINFCGPFTWPVNNQTYTNSGSYMDTLTTNQGCDSIITLNLTIGSNSAATISVSECDAYTWPLNNQTYTTSGTYNALIANSVGCDSNVTLNLTILQPTFATQTENSCGYFNWDVDGLTYLISGTYTGTLVNTQGCDSIITLNLTVYPIDLTLTTTNQTQLSSNQNGAQYQWIDCNTQQSIAGATNQSFSPSTNGSYAVVVTTSDCSDTSICETISVIGLEELNPSNFNVFPNPTSEAVRLSSNSPFRGTINLLDVNGKSLRTIIVQTVDFINIDLTKMEKGIYIVQIQSDKGTENIKVLKLQ